MRRTQLYLDDHLWKALHALAKRRNTTLSDLVREAVRNQYFGKKGRAGQSHAGVRRNSQGPFRYD
jgi:hypothetical protein